MSELDVKMQGWLSTYGGIFLFLFVLFQLTKGYLSRYRDKIFAKGEAKFSEGYNVPAAPVKAKLFKTLNDIQSADWNLRNKGLIRILEIGCGSGSNLKYFPKSARLVMVDRNEFYQPILEESMKKFPHLVLEKMVYCSAEDMRQVDSGSVDVVVSTIVLCSIDDLKAVMSEIKRVLAPGGKFYFLEHVRAKEGTRLCTVQKFLSVSRIWPALCGNGCRLDKRTDVYIKEAGFSEVNVTHLDINYKEMAAFKVIKPHIYGVATK